MDVTETGQLSDSDAIEEALAYAVAMRLLLAPVALRQRRREENTERMRTQRRCGENTKGTPAPSRARVPGV